jgi:hypothetical protein
LPQAITVKLILQLMYQRQANREVDVVMIDTHMIYLKTTHAMLS